MTAHAAGRKGFLVLLVLTLALGACEDGETARIGAVDGFGWGTGQSLADAGIVSANLIPGSTTEYYPMNLDGLGILGPGDFLPDMNALVEQAAGHGRLLDPPSVVPQAERTPEARCLTEEAQEHGAADATFGVAG